MTKVKNRIFYIDEIRVLAILFVLLVHISKWFAKAETPDSLFWIFSSSFTALGDCGVPLFFMISGALLLNRDYEIKFFLRHRLLRIFIPFIFWIIVAILLKIYLNPDNANLDYAVNIFFNGGYVWFVWTMLGIYLITPVLNSFVKDKGLGGVKYFVIIWLLTMVLSTLRMYPFMRIELRYFSGFAGYFIFGYFLNNFKPRVSQKSMMIIGLILFLISTSFVEFLIINHYIDIWPNFYYSVFPILQATGIFLFLRFFEEYCNNHEQSGLNRFFSSMKNSSVGKAITSISVCSYGMYLTHYLFIWIIMDIVDNLVLRNPFKWIPFMFIIVVLGSWGLIWIFSKIPYLKKVSGV